MSVQVPGVSAPLVFWLEMQHWLAPSTPHSLLEMHWQMLSPGVTQAPVVSWRWQQLVEHSDEVAHDSCAQVSQVKLFRLQHGPPAFSTQSAFDWHSRSQTELPSQL